MGFLDKIKKAFDTGGVSADLEAPAQFSWRDESMPLRLTLTGHESEERTINSVLFRLRESGANSENKTARDREREGIRYEITDKVVLKPGETIALDVDFPLTTSEILDRVGASDEVPGWLKTAAKVVDAGSKLSTESSNYTVTAIPKIEGARMEKGVSRKIRLVGLGDVFVGSNVL